MDRINFIFVPDAKEPYINFENEISFDECFDHIRKHCEMKEYQKTMEIYVYTKDKEPMFYIGGIVPNYEIKDDFKHLEPQVLEIFNKYFVK